MAKNPKIDFLIARLREAGYNDAMIAAILKHATHKIGGNHVRTEKDLLTGEKKKVTVPYAQRKSVLDKKDIPSNEEFKADYGIDTSVPDEKPEEPVNMNLVEGMTSFTPESAPVDTSSLFRKWQADKDLSLWLDAEGIEDEKTLRAALKDDGIENIADFEKWVKDRWVPKHVKQRTVEG